MQFLSSTNVFEGAVQLNQAPSQDSHAITRGFLKANSVVGIAADSANYAELVTESGELKLKLKPLTITDVSVDTVAASLSAWVSANYSGTEKQEGDIIILTAVSGRAQTWIHNGGQAGDVTDFTEIEGQSVSDAEVRAALSASAGVNYNSATGEITADQAEIKGFFSAGTGLAYDGANGVFSLNVDSDGISEGINNLYFTDARAQGAITVGTGLTKVGGLISFSGSTSVVAEGSNLYFTDARAQAAISVTGTGLSYSAGVIQLVASTDDISEGTKLYFTQARARQSVQADPAAGNLLTYNNVSGDIAVMTSAVYAKFSAGTGMSFSSGKFDFIGTTSIVSEGSNLYFTQARARQSVQADPSSKNLLTYMNQSGDLMVNVDKFRKEFAPQSLTANTWATLQHNLGKKIVHVSAYDVSGNLVQLDVQLIDNNNLKVKSTINVTNAEIVISI